MSQLAPEHNPFMLLTHPEVVLAAVEKSERLGQLNRHLCRPLDRQGNLTDKPTCAQGADGDGLEGADGADEAGTDDMVEIEPGV